MKKFIRSKIKYIIYKRKKEKIALDLFLGTLHDSMKKK